MKLLDEIIALVKWCCQHGKKAQTPVTPTPKQSYVLSAFAGVMAITGQPAALTYTAHTPQNYTLTAGTGSFGVTGHDAGLSGSTHVLAASRGSIAISGQAASLRARRFLRANGGSFSIGRQPANLSYGRKLQAAAGAFAIDIGAYPAGVVALGLQDVWNLASTAGPRSPTTKTVGVDTLPTGAATGIVAISTPAVVFTGTPTLSRWDMAGHIQYSDANSNFTVEDSKVQGFTMPGPGWYVGDIGNGSNSPTANYSYTDFDLGPYTNNQNGIKIGPTATFNADHCRFYNAGNDIIISLQGASNFTDCVFGRPGLLWNPLDHIESIHSAGGPGPHAFTRCLWQMSFQPGSTDPSSVMAGALELQKFGGGTDYTIRITDSIIDMRSLASLPWTMQGIDTGIRLELTNCAISRANSGYAAWFPATFGVVVSTGCVDLDDATNIDHFLNH